jgi:hypothetical protein
MRGMIRALGTPISIINGILDITGTDREVPVGGSNSLERVAEGIGVLDKPKGTLMEKIGESFGSGAVGGGMFSKAAQAVRGIAGNPMAPAAIQAMNRGIQAANIAQAVPSGIGAYAGNKVAGPTGELVGGLLGGLVPIGGTALSRSLTGAPEEFNQAYDKAKVAQQAMAQHHPGMPDPTLLTTSQSNPFLAVARRSIVAEPFQSGSNALERQIAQYDDMIGRATRGMGTKQDVGDVLNKAVKTILQEPRKTLGPQIKSILGALPQNQKIPMDNTMQVIQDLADNSAKSVQAIKDPNLARVIGVFRTKGFQGLTPKDWQTVRSTLGKMTTDRPNVMGQYRGEAKLLYQAMTNDMRQHMNNTLGPTAATTFDDLMTRYSAMKDDASKLLNGLRQKTADRMANIFLSRSQRRGEDISRLLEKVSPTDLDMIKQTLLNRIGKTNTQQGSISSLSWDPVKFSRNWNLMDDAVKNRLFSAQERGVYDTVSNLADRLGKARVTSGGLRETITARSSPAMIAVTALFSPKIAGAALAAPTVISQLATKPSVARMLRALPTISQRGRVVNLLTTAAAKFPVGSEAHNALMGAAQEAQNSPEGGQNGD